MENNSKRLSWDMPMSELVSYSAELRHSNIAYIDLDEGELMHWKYIKREKVDGKWRYYYDKDEMKNSIKGFFKETGDKISKAAIDKVNKVSGNLNSWVDNARNVISKFYDDPDNMYNVTHQSYEKKLAQIKETQEWKDIVARKDSEYIKKNKDGTVTYDIDKYLVDKKHPVLDAIGDIMAGRNVDTNEITADSFVAGIKDYATSALELGMLTIGFAVNGLTRKFQFSQGSYDDDIEELGQRVEEGAEFVSAMYNSAQDVYEKASASTAVTNVVSNLNSGNAVDPADVGKAVSEVAKMAGYNVDANQVEQITSMVTDAAKNGRNITAEDIGKAVSEVAKVAGYSVDASQVENLASMISTAISSTNAKEVASSLNDGRIVDAAQFLMESDAMKETLGTNEYYTQAESILSGLSEEEIQAVNLLLQQMRGG